MSNVGALSFTGLRLAQSIGFASATLILYDYALNLADEMVHFWGGSWTLSRGMYLFIRYLAIMQAFMVILVNTVNSVLVSTYTRATSSESDQLSSITQLIVSMYTNGIVIMVLCQAVISIRVWHMFAHSQFIRAIAVNTFIATALANGLLAGFLWHFVREAEPRAYTNAHPTTMLVWLYVPSLTLHSLLFALKVYRFATSPKYLQRDTLLWRFLKEGMIMYACALGSLLFIVVGLTMTSDSQIPVYDTAYFGSSIFIAMTAVSVCRAMLSIKSLAATVHVDPGWLLNHAELSRVQWHQGATEGEIVVEMFGNCYDAPITSD